MTILESDGSSVLTLAQAVEAAQDWFAEPEVVAACH
jgi:hypothetical protein